MWARGSAPAELRPPSYDHIPLCKILHWIPLYFVWLNGRHLSKNRRPTVLAPIQPQLIFIPSYSSRTLHSVVRGGVWGATQALECGAYDLSRRTPRPLAISVHSQRATFRR